MEGVDDWDQVPSFDATEAPRRSTSSLEAVKVSDNVDDRAVWDDDLAQRLLGKVMLVGLTYIGVDGAVVEQQQFFGQAVSVDRRKGILVALSGGRSGEHFNLPPDTRAIDTAAPGEYRRRATGDVVVNPDYTAVFSISNAP
jgi:hypothetical protein